MAIAGAAAPGEGPRCAGPAVVAGIREGALWLLTARGQPWVLPLRHAALRARCLAAAGDMAAARAVAERGVAAQGPLGGLMSGCDASSSLNEQP